MTRPDICVKVARLQFVVDSPATQKIISSQPGLNKNALGSLLQNINSHYSIKDDLIIHRVVLDLGVISRQHFSIHFHQRLHSALVKLFMQLEARTRDIPVSARETAYNADAQADIPLLAQAIACLQPAALTSTVADKPAAVIFPLLEQAVTARSAATPASAAASTAFRQYPGTASRPAQQENRPARLTAQHVALLALHYLLLESEGVRWLSQHSLAQEQRAALAAAMVRQEIPAEQLLRCIASLESLPVAQAHAIAGRWVIPLWRYPGMIQAVQQQAGKAVVQQAECYLASLLPGRPLKPLPGTTTAQQHSSPGATTHFEQHNHRVTTATRSGQQTQRTAAVRQHAVSLAGERLPASGLPVTNAGAILFWPLFTQWFTTLGLMEEKQFVSDDARWQAVVAIDWLVWEQEMPDAQRLVINQFLCGLPLSEPPAPLAPLTPELRQRTLAWVEAISQQLAAFEKMSLTDIRLLFLQRPGELFADLTPAVLNIEPQPFDVLLTKWPWPLNLAYFPWFDVPLIIEWPGSEPAGARL